MLNRFSCVALAGVATEYLLYGYAEGGLDDINKVQPTHLDSHFLQLKSSYPFIIMNARNDFVGSVFEENKDQIL